MFNKIPRSYFTTFLIIAVLLGAFKLFTFYKNESKEKSEYQERFGNDYNIFAVTLPEKLDFCGENVPLDIFDVKESLDREMLVNTYWQSNSLLLLKRAHRWFPAIETILRQNNVPDDFKYLAVIESGLLNVSSPSGAKGFWQILEGTGNDLKLEINEDIDERYHIEKSTIAACKYLKKSYNNLGSWTTAAAAYNMGPTGFKRQLNKQQMTSYYDLDLNSETARYVFRILALKVLMENPQKYGFNYREQDLYAPIPYYEVKIDSTINNLSAFAVSQKSSLKYVKMLNPWLRSNQLPNKSGKVYTIKFPRKDLLKLGDLNYLTDTTKATNSDYPE